MPQIKEYTNRTEVAGPIQTEKATAEDFGSGVGAATRRLGGALDEGGNAVYRRVEQDEISDQTVKLSELHAKMTEDLRDQLQKGTLKTEDVKQKLDDSLSNMGGDYSTVGARQAFERSAAAMKSHFMESAAAGQAQLAGERAVANYHQTLNNYSAALENDPSSNAVLKQQHGELIDNLVKTQGLPAEQAEKLRVAGNVEIDKSTVRGWIKLNPQDAKGQLASGKWDDVGGEVKHQLVGEADQEIRAREAEAERQRVQQERIKKEQEKITQDDLLHKLVDNTLTAKDVMDAPIEAFGSGSKEQFIQLMRTQAEHAEKIRTDPGTFISLYQRIHLPDGDPKKLTDENELNPYFGKGLTIENVKELRNEMQGKGTIAGENASALKTQVFKTAEAALSKANPMLGIKDPGGEENLARFLTNFQQEYAAGKAKGKSDKELLSPESPDYLGKSIANYAKTPSQIMQSLVDANRPRQVVAPEATPSGTPPPAANPLVRKPGESIEAWRKRTGRSP